MRLAINGRPRLPNDAFSHDDRLFRGYCLDDLDDQGNLRAEYLRFPDLSCNWDRFSAPAHVRYRPHGRETDGCYSFTVETARFKSIATPVHEPIESEDYENYAHVEVRLLPPGEQDVLKPPPREQKAKGKKAKADRLEWRIHVARSVTFELLATGFLSSNRRGS